MHVPRPIFLIRLAIALALTLGILSLAASPSLSAPGFAKDKHGQGHNGKSHKYGKHDNGKHKGQKKDKEKHKNGKNKGKKRVAAEQIAAYTVRVDCSYDAATDQTTCTIDADHPEGSKKINLFVLSADDVCAPVISSDANYVDPDPNTGATGYRSTDSDGRLTLTLSGNVTAGGHATYWIKAASTIFPATGTGLVCANDAANQTSANVTPTPAVTQVPVTPEVTDTTGSVVVQAYDCPVATPQADYDWYGQCAPVPPGSRYRLTRTDTETRDGLTTSTDATGRATFRSLPPGTYELTQAEGDWCFAQSDNVKTDGSLTVAAGERTSVWIFVCASAP